MGRGSLAGTIVELLNGNDLVGDLHGGVGPFFRFDTGMGRDADSCNHETTAPFSFQNEPVFRAAGFEDENPLAVFGIGFDPFPGRTRAHLFIAVKAHANRQRLQHTVVMKGFKDMQGHQQSAFHVTDAGTAASVTVCGKGSFFHLTGRKDRVHVSQKQDIELVR